MHHHYSNRKEVTRGEKKAPEVTRGEPLVPSHHFSSPLVTFSRVTISPMRLILQSGIFSFALFLPSLCLAAFDPSFSDVPRTHPAHAEIEDLATRGYIQGNPDGTFGPEDLLSRAAALKLIVGPVSTLGDLRKYSKSSYEDVSNLEWYFPFVEHAGAALSIIDRPPKALRFFPDRTVTKAEFLKMLLRAHGVPLALFESIRAPFATDIENAQEWYVPYARVAVASSMVPMNDEGTFGADHPLTRADAAQILSWFLRYQNGGRTQVLLDQTEDALLSSMQQLGDLDLKDAAAFALRARLTAYGAAKSAPFDSLVQGFVKLSEGFWLLMLSWQQVMTEQWEAAEKNLAIAATRADQAELIAPELKGLSTALNELIEKITLEVEEGKEKKE